MSDKTKQESSITVIEPRNGWFDIDFKDLWKYRDLILLFVKRNFVSQYKQTVLGPAWALIQPLLTTVVFTVVFGNLAGLGPSDDCPSFLFFMTGTVFWTFFANCITNTSTTFTANSAILGKVYFPRLVMPISTTITQFISFFIQLAMLVVFIIIYAFLGQVHPNLWILATPIILLQMACLGLGVGIIVSALTTKYRDLTMLVSFGVQLWMYATPVAYDMFKIIPEQFMGI